LAGDFWFVGLKMVVVGGGWRVLVLMMVRKGLIFKKKLLFNFS
jgi:hypothetical protein